MRNHPGQELCFWSCWLLLLCAVGCGATTEHRSSSDRDERLPNVVFILADDLGYGEVGYQGQTKIRTPRIDQLAREGLRFTQHYSGAPVCASSRCVLMTGLHTGHAYVRGNKGKPVAGQLPIPTGTVTVAKLLQQAGYRTGAVGKWGLGGPDTTGVPNQQGFDFWYGYLDQWRAHYYYPDYLYRNDQKEALPGNDGKFGETYAHDLITDEALKFVDRASRDEPFFLYVAYTIPHVSLQVPEDSLAEYLGEWEETPYPGAHYTGHPQPRAAYAAMITRMDRDIGRIVDRIDELGLGEDTLVVFSSDNGPTYAGGVDYEFFDSAGPLRGLKGSLWEGGIRVPTVARWPGRIGTDTETDHISGFQDWLPTLAEFAGVDYPSGLDGISLKPTLVGGNQRSHDYLYWEHSGRWQAVRFGQWKASRRRPNARVELYNLATDLGETKNVAAAHPEEVAQAVHWMQTGRTPSQHFPLERPAVRLTSDGVLAKDGWSVVRTSSESKFNGKTADRAIDGDPATWWHSEWQNAQPPHPHELVIDLGSERTLRAVRYLARQDGGWNGTIDRFEVSVSRSPTDLGRVVHSGRFAKIRDEQESVFETPVRGRYLLLRTLSAHDDKPFASIGEFGVVGE